MWYVFSYNVYDLIDPWFTLSYVTLFVAKKFGIVLGLLCELFIVLTLIGEFIIATKVYYNYVAIECSCDNNVNLIELDMVNFDVFMGID